MMTRMFGFFACAEALGAEAASPRATANAETTGVIFLLNFIRVLLFRGSFLTFHLAENGWPRRVMRPHQVLANHRSLIIGIGIRSLYHLYNEAAWVTTVASDRSGGETLTSNPDPRSLTILSGLAKCFPLPTGTGAQGLQRVGDPRVLIRMFGAGRQAMERVSCPCAR